MSRRQKMIFKKWVKTGEIRYERNGYEDYDGDTGYWVDIDVEPDNVNKALVKIIIDYYDFPKNDDMKEKLLPFIEDINQDDSLAELFKDELQDFFEDWEE